MRMEHVVAGLIILITLAACGTQPGERALSGAGIGGAAGAVGAAVIGGPVVAGAAVGAAAGAVTGALSDPDRIRLD